MTVLGIHWLSRNALDRKTPSILEGALRENSQLGDLL